MIKYLLVLTAFLAGCASNPTVEERTNTVTVKVPVVTAIPEPREVARPQLAIFSLTPEDAEDPGKVILFYQATVKQLQGYAIELETIIDGYRTLSKESSK